MSIWELSAIEFFCSTSCAASTTRTTTTIMMMMSRWRDYHLVKEVNEWEDECELHFSSSTSSQQSSKLFLRQDLTLLIFFCTLIDLIKWNLKTSFHSFRVVIPFQMLSMSSQRRFHLAQNALWAHYSAQQHSNSLNSMKIIRFNVHCKILQEFNSLFFHSFSLALFCLFILSTLSWAHDEMMMKMTLHEWTSEDE